MYKIKIKYNKNTVKISKQLIGVVISTVTPRAQGFASCLGGVFVDFACSFCA